MPTTSPIIFIDAVAHCSTVVLDACMHHSDFFLASFYRPTASNFFSFLSSSSCSGLLSGLPLRSVWLTNAGSCVDPRNKIGHPAHRHK